MPPDVRVRLADEIAPLRAYVRTRISSFLRSRESLTDFVHGVCLEALADAGLKTAVDDATFRRRLFRCARNALLDRARFLHRDCRDGARERPFDEAGAAPAGYGGGTPSRHATAREELVRLERALAALPPSHREVIVLSRIEGLNAEQIARRMDRTVPAVWTLLSRALARLGTLIDERPSP